jgi:hypothetical protein
MLVNMAVDIHLRSLDARRTQLEESQLARSILRMIADDLRGAVQHFEQDTSGIESLLQQSVASAAESLGQAATGATAGAASGASIPTGDQPNNANLGGNASADQSSSSGARGGASAEMSRGATSSSAGGANQSSFSTSSSGSSSSTAIPAGQNTEDLATATIPPVPGLFGNQFQLQVDVSRLPRVEDYQRYLTPDAATAVVDIPSDVKTVTYFVQSMPAGSVAAESQSLADLSDPTANGTGLIRRVLDRSVTLWAMSNGNYTGLQNSGEVVAPEVAAIEFQYFDGTEWLMEWDSEVEKKLPIAVLVIVALRPPGSEVIADAPLSNLTPDTAGNLHLYRMLVHLPAGGQSAPEESSSVPSAPTSDSSSAGTTTGGSP